MSLFVGLDNEVPGKACYISLQKSICYFDNYICHQNCNCWLEIVPCGSQLWQYNTHGVHEQLKLLQGLGSLLRHQISAIHNKGHCSLAKILVMWTAVLIPICDLFNHNESHYYGAILCTPIIVGSIPCTGFCWSLEETVVLGGLLWD